MSEEKLTKEVLNKTKWKGAGSGFVMDVNTVVYIIANLCSTLIILLCTFIKVPQILYIKEKRSADGIYIQAMMMEMTGFTIVSLYNYTNEYGVITYLEYPIILMQVYIMFYYVLKYKRMLHLSIVPVVAMIYFSLVAAFMIGLIPKEILNYLLPFCTPLSGFAKVTYIYGIVKAGNADAVSLTTWMISISSNFARIFTVYLDSADFKLMANFTISTLLSTGVLITALYYQNQPQPIRHPPPRRKPSTRRHSHFD
ncbi:solute carrier family 66 member 3-like [Achroia grisella]|uniref:solute carrier family 66 member 3-like n=1 Tax=Achroia grisella TaxID=688607 RepID=UPI0027D32067|nr:solute carrier family 66 member 3-like [Achroia grisella]